MPPLTSLHLLLIIATIIGVAIGRYPFLRMNRATIALTGATALIATGAIGLEEAYGALDLNTIVLLFAMMILNYNLRRAGFFQLVANRVIHHAHTQRQLLAYVILASGILSAVFLNDTIVLVFTPLVLDISFALNQRPQPYLVALVMAANLGSAHWHLVGHSLHRLHRLSDRARTRRSGGHLAGDHAGLSPGLWRPAGQRAGRRRSAG
jgi:Na+/H+ antiporter NhaD/arsenite permease-like protein